MWLVYLRYEDQEKVDTYHLLAGNKKYVDEILRKAQLHGVTKTAELVEYAAFYTSGTIKKKLAIVPNFHFDEESRFFERWETIEAELKAQVNLDSS